MAGVMSNKKIRDIKAYLEKAPGITIPVERSGKTLLLKKLQYNGKAITDEGETITLTYEELEASWKYATEQLSRYKVSE